MSFEGMIPIQETNDMSESLKELNRSDIDPKSGMSEIDMRTRLTGLEIPAILTIDTLVALQVLPQEMLAVTLQKKRLAVSLYAQGRKEIVRIAVGKREDEQQPKNTLLSRFQSKPKSD